MTHSEVPNNATIQIPGATAAAPRQSIASTFEKMEGKRLHLVTRSRVPAFTALSVEYNDAMFLGEVVACTQHANDSWHLEIKVEQVLTGLQSLVNLRARLLGEGVPHVSPAQETMSVDTPAYALVPR